MSAVRVIVLGNKKQIPLGVYVRGIQACMAAPAGTEYKHGLRGWVPETREVILDEWRDSVHDRINRHLAGFGRGRKWTWEWQVETYRAAQALNTPRLAIHWLPAWLRDRFRGRLHTEG